jgi:putative endonuclease
VKPAKKAIGRWGEEQAQAFLRLQGYEILGRNVRTRYGELDLIARQDAPEIQIVFVEVKTRRTAALGYPEISVDTKKQAHLLASAQAYLLEHPELGGEYRIDVIAIRALDPEAPPEIIHFPDAVRADE